MIVKMRNFGTWTSMNEDVLDKILEGASRFSMIYREGHYVEYIVLYSNGYGFSVSKTRKGVDTWEIIMLKGTEIGECDFYYDSEITSFNVIPGLTDEDLIEKALAIKNF